MSTETLLTDHLRRSTAHRIAAIGLTVIIGLSACSTSDTAPDATPTSAGDEQRVTVTAPLPDPTLGLTTTGWLEATGAFGDLPLGDSPIDAWPELLAAVPGPSGPLDVTVTTVVERDPDACTLWRVLVEEVTFGDGPVAERMRTTVLRTLNGIDHDPGLLLAADQEPWCTGREREALAWYATVLTPAFCALPDGDPLQCLMVVTMRYDGGAHPNTVHTDLVFDAATGSLLDVATLLESRGLDIDTATAFVESTVCDLDIAEGLLGEGDGCWMVTLRNARPTPAGLILSFAPYESGPYAFGPRDLFVPWVELDAGAAVPAAARATQRDLRVALASGDWSLVAALVPTSGGFLVATGEESADPVAALRALPRDPRPEILIALSQRPGRARTTTVWPELAARDPFAIGASERTALASAFGADSVAAWEAAGRYLGWRAGIDDDGTWRFIVAGD